MNEVESKRLITDFLQTKCSSCGGTTEFSPTDQTLKCIYCGHATELDLTPVEIKENDFEYWAAQTDEDLSSESVEAAEIKCKQCGAVTTLPPEKASTNCAFCGTPLILNEAEIKRFWQPEYILPFALDHKECNSMFQQWLRKRWFLPNQLKRGNVQTQRFKGVYLPFWTYDAHTYTDYKGKQGIRRRVTTRNAKGEIKTRTVTDWYYKSGTIELDFDDVIVPASNSLPDKLMRRLSNWDRTNCVAFRKEFLAGFTTDLYSIDFREGIHTAKHKMEVVIDEHIRRDIGGDEQHISAKYVSYQDLMFKLLLLPVWVSAFKYNDKLYQFVVNGRNGEVFGEYPKDKFKILFLVLGIIALITVLILLFS